MGEDQVVDGPFSCEYCDARFRRYRPLMTHKRSCSDQYHKEEVMDGTGESFKEDKVKEEISAGQSALNTGLLDHCNDHLQENSSNYDDRVGNRNLVAAGDVKKEMFCQENVAKNKHDDYGSFITFGPPLHCEEIEMFFNSLNAAGGNDSEGNFNSNALLQNTVGGLDESFYDEKMFLYENEIAQITNCIYDILYNDDGGPPSYIYSNSAKTPHFEVDGGFIGIDSYAQETSVEILGFDRQSQFTEARPTKAEDLNIENDDIGAYRNGTEPVIKGESEKHDPSQNRDNTEVYPREIEEFEKSLNKVIGSRDDQGDEEGGPIEEKSETLNEGIDVSGCEGSLLLKKEMVNCFSADESCDIANGDNSLQQIDEGNECAALENDALNTGCSSETKKVEHAKRSKSVALKEGLRFSKRIQENMYQNFHKHLENQKEENSRNLETGGAGNKIKPILRFSRRIMHHREVNNTRKDVANHSKQLPRRKKDYQKTLKCKHCSKKFAQQSKLEEHMRSHIDEKLHKCKTCGKRFKCKSSVDIHQRLHTRIRPVKCNECGEWFMHKKQLDKHQRLVHQPSGHLHVRPMCEKCGRIFIYQYSLTVHRRIHGEAKPCTWKNVKTVR